MTFGNLLRYRRAWLGFAMVWIVLVHLPVYSPFYILNTLISIGYGGVDICFFASGIGCYYSLSSDADVGNFIKKRLHRLVPCYLVFLVPWLLLKYICKEFTVQMAIGNILAIQNFTGLGNAFNWYISAIFLFYLLAPYFKIVIDRTSPFIKSIFLVFLIVFSIPFWGSYTYIITVTRLPIFYFGMLFATVCQQNPKMTRRNLAVLGIAFLVGALLLAISMTFFSDRLWSHGLYWYPFLFMTPAICVAISYVMCFMERTKVLSVLASALSLVGDYSFEIYLLHIPLVEIVSACIGRFGLEDVQSFVWLAGIPVLALGCFVLRSVTSFCISLLSKKRVPLNRM